MLETLAVSVPADSGSSPVQYSYALVFAPGSGFHDKHICDAVFQVCGVQLSCGDFHLCAPPAKQENSRCLIK